MLRPENSFEIEICPYCQFRREIIAIKFPLFRPAIALFLLSVLWFGLCGTQRF
jgi:hypothetical protein